MSEDLANLKLESNLSGSDESPPNFTVARLEAIIDRLSTLIRTEEKLQIGAVLASLNFESRPARHSAITEAHNDTFQWAFTPQSSHLSEWLHSGSGIFWVSGKAGSGKSTFMKFLAGHTRTHELLKEWASANDVGIGAHYFWSAGTAMQKSHQGLLQSLLFDLFRNNPEVIRAVCLKCWPETNPLEWAFPLHTWTVPGLEDCLQTFASMKDPLKKFCFFIDGLDEYDGDLIELCKVLQKLSATLDIKVCASSRPWVQFEDDFGGDEERKLYMHDLTRSDIENFTRYQLESHPRWEFQYTELNENDKRELIEEVAQRAEGVFLWAFLVTRSLRDGLSHDDTVADMRKRLESLPRDLETLFKHMLESVDEIYHSKMASALQVATHAFEPLSSEIYWHFEKELEEYNYAVLCPMVVPSIPQQTKQREIVRRRINARTKGLLAERDGVIEFLHRTVRDFLLTRDMTEYLRSKLGNDFNVFHSISKAHLALLKTSFNNPPAVFLAKYGPESSRDWCVSCLSHGLLYTAEALTASLPGFSDHMRLLDEFEQSVVKIVGGSQTSLGRDFRFCDPRAIFREEVVKHQLARFVDQKIQEDTGYFNVLEDSPLFSALMPPIAGRPYPSNLSPLPDIIWILLRLGYGPNMAPRNNKDSEACTPWTSYAGRYLLNTGVHRKEVFQAALETGTTNMFLFFGADPDALFSRQITIFTKFLVTSLRESGSCDIETVLLTLDAFLARRPGLGDKSQVSCISNWLLGHSYEVWGPSGIANSARILEKLIKYLLEHQEDVQPLANPLREAFPSDQRHAVKHIFDMMEKGSVRPPKKRKSRDTGDQMENIPTGKRRHTRNMSV